LSRIQATSYSKSLRSAPQAKDAWAKVLQRGQTDPEEILDVRNVGYDVLRLARVRLHAVECLLWRLFFHQQNVESVDLILFSDGSPQGSRNVSIKLPYTDTRSPPKASRQGC